jgi:hypothetical protein
MYSNYITNIFLYLTYYRLFLNKNRYYLYLSSKLSAVKTLLLIDYISALLS